MPQMEMHQSSPNIFQEQEGVSALDMIIEHGRLGREPEQAARAKDLITEFVRSVIDGNMVISNDVEATINARIAEIDRLVSLQLNEVMHHPKFQRLEAAWRGLRYFVFETETSTMLKIKVLDASKKEIYRDLNNAIEFDQSQMFKKFYEEEFGTFGGTPFSFIVADFEITNHPQDSALLTKVSQVAAAAHCPFLTAVSPEFFGWETFEQLAEIRDLAKIPDQEQYCKWKSFRESEDSRFVGLALPHILIREPYGQATNPTETFNFEEDVDGTDHRKYCWANAAYALATRITDAIAQFNWAVAIRGVEGGGLVRGLPIHTFKTDDGDVAIKCPTEIAITDRREKEFADLGFIPLVHCKHTDYAAFFAVQSCNKAKKYDTDSANANARLATQLPYIFATSRFAHYLKIKMRQKIGTFTSREELEKYLNRWISFYVLDDDTASQEAKAQYPLREARVEVAEVPGKPGVYKAIAFLRPHFQLDELTMSLRLVATLPTPKEL